MGSFPQAVGLGCHRAVPLGLNDGHGSAGGRDGKSSPSTASGTAIWSTRCARCRASGKPPAARLASPSPVPPRHSNSSADHVVSRQILLSLFLSLIRVIRVIRGQNL